MFGPLSRVLGRLYALLGMYAVYFYATSGLTLSHYDAKAHLVVARRILDSLTPGWVQIGAVWLPLPHLINMLPVQIDLLYRSGGFAVALSVLSHALAVSSIAGTVLLLTASPAGAVLAATLFATNPNVLYLQSTPMTEPLLFGLTTLLVWLVVRWMMNGQLGDSTRAIGWTMVLACLTRYEAWPVTACVFVASMFAWWRRGETPVQILRVHLRLALYPICTAVAFMVWSRITVGEWFVSSGFFVPDESLRGNPAAVYEKIIEGTTSLAGSRFVRIAQVSAVVVALLALVRRERAGMAIPLALLGCAALPVSAYLAGHPFRVRYEIPIVVAGAVLVGLAVGQLRRLAQPAAALIVLLVYLQQPPFDPRAPMLREAQLDVNNSRGREQVTACLRREYDGTTIMASMGSLGHYMHELSAANFRVRDFLHEGNGPLWDSAFTRGPAPLVGGVLVEEKAEGGDAIAQRYRQHPGFLEGFERVCEGGNVALYRRRDNGRARFRYQVSGIRYQGSGRFQVAEIER
jgi:hypothetical protein